MKKVDRFEDLVAWQKARELTKQNYQFTVIAKASCAEVRSQLYVALDAGYIKEDKFKRLYDLSVECSRILGGLRVSLQK